MPSHNNHADLRNQQRRPDQPRQCEAGEHRRSPIVCAAPIHDFTSPTVALAHHRSSIDVLHAAP
jgi:hypothetical protein